MRKTLLASAAAAVAAAAGVALVVGVATGSPDPAASLKSGAAFEPVGATLRQVAVPAAGSSAARAAAPRAKNKKKQKPVRIKYFEFPPFALGDGEAVGDRLRCPKRHKPLSGYFAADAVDVALAYSAPVSRRAWFVGITKFGNIAGQPNPAQAIIGVVCAQNVR